MSFCAFPVYRESDLARDITGETGGIKEAQKADGDNMHLFDTSVLILSIRARYACTGMGSVRSERWSMWEPLGKLASWDGVLIIGYLSRPLHVRRTRHGALMPVRSSDSAGLMVRDNALIRWTTGIRGAPA